MRSSYIENGYGQLFQNYVVNLRPCPILVELGVLDGYSTIHLAKGIRDMQDLYGHVAKLDAWDLFEDYEFKHGNQAEIQGKIDAEELTSYVELRKGSAFEAARMYGDESIELLHIDISNTGENVRQLIDLWHPKLAPRAILMIEGGSEERDNVEWMKKYGYPSLKQEIVTNPILNKWYLFGTYYRFPSITVGMKKWYNPDNE